MKLQQLCEYTFPTIKHRKVTKLPDVYHHGSGAAAGYRRGHVPAIMHRNVDVEHLGTGHFASAYSHKERPHDVRKVSRKSDTSDTGEGIDGFYYYLMELSKHKDNANPYFPHFSGATVYEDPNGDIVYSVQMERLFHVNKLSRREKLAIVERMFGQNFDRTKTEFRPRLHLSDIVADVIRGNDLKHHIVEENFKNAAEFIVSVAEKHNSSIDIHVENIMIRRSPYGSQVVITDPLSFST